MNFRRYVAGPAVTLRARLMALSIVALLPGFIVVASTEYRIDQSRKAEVRTLALNNARQAAYALDRILLGVSAVFTVLEHAPAIRSGDPSACTAYLKSVLPDISNLTSLSVADRSGSIVCGTTLRDKPLNISDRNYFRDALTKPGMVLGQYTVGRGTGRAILPVSMSIRDAAGAPVAVLAAGIDLAWLGGQLRERGLPPGGSITVADRDGVIIAREPRPQQFVGTKTPQAYMRLVNASEPGVETVLSQDETPRVLGYIPLSGPAGGLYVSVGLSVEESYTAVNRAARIGVLLAVLAAVGTLAATWIAGSRVFVRPLQDLKSVIERWRAGERTARTGLGQDGGEISDLGATLDRMMDEIASNHEQRDLLTNELAHRVKNTLAIVQAIAILTMNKSTPAKETLPDFLSRVTALGHTHDVLTRESWDGAGLRELIIRVAEPLSSNVAHAFRFDGPPVTLPPREALGMTMVVHELCTNALKYGALSVPGGIVLVSWSFSNEPCSELEITWREQGGPEVSAPRKNVGFGTRLVSRALGEHGTTSLDYQPDGLICRIRLLISAPETQATA
jgi:two-component sensor histidine kinase